MIRPDALTGPFAVLGLGSLAEMTVLAWTDDPV